MKIISYRRCNKGHFYIHYSYLEEDTRDNKIWSKIKSSFYIVSIIKYNEELFKVTCYSELFKEKSNFDQQYRVYHNGNSMFISENEFRIVQVSKYENIDK